MPSHSPVRRRDSYDRDRSYDRSDYRDVRRRYDDDYDRSRRDDSRRDESDRRSRDDRSQKSITVPDEDTEMQNNNNNNNNNGDVAAPKRRVPVSIEELVAKKEAEKNAAAKVDTELFILLAKINEKLTVVLFLAQIFDKTGTREASLGKTSAAS